MEEEENRQEDEEDLEGDLERDFLEVKPHNAILAGNGSGSDKSITFPNFIAEKYYYTDSPRPQGGIAVPCINITLRGEEEIVKAYVSDLKDMSTGGLNRGLR